LHLPSIKLRNLLNRLKHNNL